MRLTQRDDDAYTESGKWKCSKSFSRAHYWIITGNIMRCKYCHQVKQVDTRTVYQIMRQQRNVN